MDYDFAYQEPFLIYYSWLFFHFIWCCTTSAVETALLNNKKKYFQGSNGKRVHRNWWWLNRMFMQNVAAVYIKMLLVYELQLQGIIMVFTFM
jgi:hypothetical protein